MPFPQRVVSSRTDIEDVYQENTQNILQKTSVSNMIGVLEQLNKISIFAAEIFTDILQATEGCNNRIKKVRGRIGSIDSKLEWTEKLFLDNSPSYFYDNPYPGKEWQRKDPLTGLLFRRDRASKSVNARRSAGLPLPDLSQMDRISASGPCVKKYSDTNFFMNEWLEAEKKKMEEEKAKRRERKKKRKKRKRQQKEKITGIERWVYDPITGQKVKKKAAEIAVTKYELTDSNVGALDFETADQETRGRMANKVPVMASSKVAQMARNEKTKQIQKQKKKKEQLLIAAAAMEEKHPGGSGGGPPPVPGVAVGGPPPVPVAKPGGVTVAGSGPPPVPNAVGGGGGPPPVPVPGHGVANGGGGPPPVPIASGPPPVPRVPVQKKKLTGAEMAALSAQRAESSGAYRRPVAVQKAASPKAANASKPNALMAGIRSGIQLKKTTVVKREPKMEKRDMLLAALKKKGQTGLKKVAADKINVKKEESVDNTIFAILNRRQFMADDSDSETGSDWSSSDY